MHASNSAQQQSVESYVIEKLNEELRINLKQSALKLTETVSVQVDGLDDASKTLCEVYARVGKLKGSQPDKIASDILKMQLIAQKMDGDWRKIIGFCSEEAASALLGKSWLAEVARSFDIEVRVVDLPQQYRKRITDAQDRQKMVNAT